MGLVVVGGAQRFHGLVSTPILIRERLRPVFLNGNGIADSGSERPVCRLLTAIGLRYGRSPGPVLIHSDNDTSTLP
jgi:hypothetical protein